MAYELKSGLGCAGKSDCGCGCDGKAPTSMFASIPNVSTWLGDTLAVIAALFVYDWLKKQV